jgi:hypothetical protein
MQEHALAMQLEPRIYRIRSDKVMMGDNLILLYRVRTGTVSPAMPRKLNDLEIKYDAHFEIGFDAVRELMTRAEQPKSATGFHS